MKKGYTIVEIVVVMAIIGIMSAVGVATMINIRKNADVDKATEETLMLIRETQNNSIAVKNDSSGNATKVWATYFQSSLATGAGYDPNTVKIYSWYPTAGNLEQNTTPEKALKMPSGVNLTVYNNAGAENWSGFVSYVVPFGAGNILIGSNCRSAIDTACHWEESQKPTREWYVKFLSVLGQGYVYNAINNPDKNMTLKIEGNGYSRRIIIKASGDAYIQ